MSPPRLVSKNETPNCASIRSVAWRFAAFPLRPSVITWGCSHSSNTSGTVPALRAATRRRCNSHAAPYSIIPRSTTSISFMASVLSTLNSQRLSLFPRDNPLDLLHVIDIVPGHHLDDALDGLHTPLGMHAVMFPLLSRQRFQQCDVGGTSGTELLERLARVAFSIMSCRRPRILIERLYRRPRRAQNLAHPPARDN